MQPLIISRKTKQGFGGLSRFYAELSAQFPTRYDLSPDNLQTLFKLPFLKPSHIYLCDATLLPVGVVLKKLFHKPLVITAHGLDITYANPLYQAMIHTLLPHTDAVVLDSLPANELLKKYSLKKPVKVISLGVTTSHLKKSQPLSLPHRKNSVVLTTVGNLVKRKGHAWFIKNVFPKLPKNYLYYIVGNGPEETRIKKTITEQHLTQRVFLLGRLSHEKLRFVLQHTDVYVCPNQHQKDNFESFGIAMTEAAALGIPVVASGVDGISEAIKHKKNGLLIAPKPTVFVRTLTLLQNAKIRKTLGEKAQKFTQTHFSWEKTADSYARFFAAVSKTQQFV